MLNTLMPPFSPSRSSPHGDREASASVPATACVPPNRSPRRRLVPAAALVVLFVVLPSLTVYAIGSIVGTIHAPQACRLDQGNVRR